MAERNHWENPAALVVYRLQERNKLAETAIQEFASKHGKMDVVIGIVSMIPGVAIPALITGITMQGPLIYQPLARELARIYLAPPDQLESCQRVVLSETLNTAMIDIAAEFGASFFGRIAREVVAELGFGAILAACVPIFGAVAAGILDYKIATMMTRRVGTMVSIYFQNDASWLQSIGNTYEIAKQYDGTIDGIRSRVSKVRDSLIQNVTVLVQTMREYMGPQQISAALQKQGVPADLVEEVLRTT